MHCSHTLRQTGCQVFRSKKHPVFWILLSEDLRPARTLCVVPFKSFHSLNDRSKTRRPLLNLENDFQFCRIPNSTGRRGIGMIAVKILRNALKIRYLLLGGAIGGGYSLQKVRFILNICFNKFKFWLYCIILTRRCIKTGLMVCLICHGWIDIFQKMKTGMRYEIRSYRFVIESLKCG